MIRDIIDCNGAKLNKDESFGKDGFPDKNGKYHKFDIICREEPQKEGNALFSVIDENGEERFSKNGHLAIFENDLDAVWDNERFYMSYIIRY